MDRGFYPVDSGFQVLNNGLLICEIPVFSWIPKGRIPDAQAKIPRSPESYLPFTWENRKFRLENQMVHAIPCVKCQILWAAILGDAIFPLSHVCSVDLDKFCIETVVLPPLQILLFYVYKQDFSPEWFVQWYKHPLHGANCWCHAICVGTNS